MPFLIAFSAVVLRPAQLPLVLQCSPCHPLGHTNRLKHDVDKYIVVSGAGGWDPEPEVVKWNKVPSTQDGFVLKHPSSVNPLGNFQDAAGLSSQPGQQSSCNVLSPHFPAFMSGTRCSPALRGRWGEQVCKSFSKWNPSLSFSMKALSNLTKSSVFCQVLTQFAIIPPIPVCVSIASDFPDSVVSKSLLKCRAWCPSTHFFLLENLVPNHRNPAVNLCYHF